ncbi:MAG: 30S ribosomal protein S6 [Patescibacteria group bacterium]
MSKTKKTGTTHYEILFIIPNKFTDEEAKKLTEEIEKTLTENNGEISHREYWGKKKLAYPIKQNVYGYYGLFEFDLEGKDLAKIDQTFRLSTNILRHQIVIKKKKSDEELAREKEIQVKIDSKKATEDKKREEKVKTSSPSATSASKVKEKTEKKVDLKDLDEKLEGILNAKDLI